MWITSSYQCESRSVNFISFQSWWWLVLLACSETAGGLGTGESYNPVMFSDLLLHRSSCFANVDLSAFTGNPVDYAVLVGRD